MKGRLISIFRVDASAEIGLGHLMRCLALAGELHRRGSEVLFVMRASRPEIQRLILTGGYRAVFLRSGSRVDEDAEAVREEVARGRRDGKTPVVILDGYQFVHDYHRTIMTSGAILVVMDDWASGLKDAHLIVNQNMWATRELYRDLAPHVRILAGPQYALLRDEFVQAARNRPKSRSAVERILVTLGGGDSEDATGQVAGWLDDLSISTRFTILAGPGYPHVSKLRLWSDARTDRFCLVNSPPNVAAIMAKADLAITTAGSTCWELCFMGIPALVIVVAENQLRTAEALEKAGIAENLGWFSRLKARRLRDQLTALVESPDRRQTMSEAAFRAVDGLGAERVASEIIELARSLVTTRMV